MGAEKVLGIEAKVMDTQDVECHCAMPLKMVILTVCLYFSPVKKLFTNKLPPAGSRHQGP